MTLDDLHRVQEIDYELLCEVDRICKKNQIRYFLFYGTLLGAVRHKGPIPWDDDVDICMMRNDYLRFYEVAQKELDSSKYYCKIMGSGSLRYLSELKIGKKGTLYCMPGTEGTGVADNVSLDVFCLEPVKHHSPSIHNLYIKIWNVLRTIKQNSAEKKLLSICIDRSNHPLKPFFTCALWGSHLLRLLLGERFFEWVGYQMFFDKTSQSTILWDSSMPLLFDRSWFDKSIDWEYGDGMFPIPSGYDALLKNSYGNYMQFPPEENRYNKYFDIWVFKEF